MTDEQAMDVALEEAATAGALGDVPVGAVVLSRDGNLLAKAHNQRELLSDPTAHAEILALQRAARALGSWRLTATTLLITLEPCPMCAGALVAARVARLVFGAVDPKAGAAGSLYNLCSDPRLNHQLEVVGGIREQVSSDMLSGFFAARRSR